MRRLGVIALAFSLATGAACSGGSDTEWQAGPGGGEHDFANGVRISIPPDALAGDATLRVGNAAEVPATVEGGPEQAGPAVSVELDGADLQAPARISTPAGDVGQDSSGGLLYLARAEADGTWTPMGDVYDEESNSVSAKTDHFSLWQMMHWSHEAILDKLRPVFEPVFGGGVGGLDPPSCPNPPADVALDVSSGPDGALFACVDGVGSKTVIKIRNARFFPVSLGLAPQMTAELSSHGSMEQWVWSAVSGAIGNRGPVLPSMAEAVVTVDLAPGGSLGLTVQPSRGSLVAGMLATIAKIYVSYLDKIEGPSRAQQHVQKLFEAEGTARCAYSVLGPDAPGDTVDAGVVVDVSKKLLDCLGAVANDGHVLGDLPVLASAIRVANGVVVGMVGSGQVIADSLTGSYAREIVVSRTDRLSKDDRLRLDGIGPVKVGMTVVAARRAAGVQITDPDDELDNGCGYSQVPSIEGLLFMVVDGTIRRVDVDGATATEAGARVGDTEDRIRELYRGKLTEEPHEYESDTGGKYLEVRSGKHWLLFETDGSEVTRMRAGEADAVQLVEGCA